MRYLIILTIAFVTFHINSYSKEITEKLNADETENNLLHHNKFQLETDPLAWAIGGGSIHGAYNLGQHRFQIGLAFLALPEGLQDNKEVSEEFKSISLKYDYFLNNITDNGWFVGSTIDLLEWSYEDEFNEIIETESLNIGIRIGYKYVPFDKNSSFNGLYLTPWIGLSNMFNNDDLEFKSGTYERNPIKVFPTVHIGWEF